MDDGPVSDARNSCSRGGLAGQCDSTRYGDHREQYIPPHILYANIGMVAEISQSLDKVVVDLGTGRSIAHDETFAG